MTIRHILAWCSKNMRESHRQSVVEGVEQGRCYKKRNFKQQKNVHIYGKTELF